MAGSAALDGITGAGRAAALFDVGDGKSTDPKEQALLDFVLLLIRNRADVTDGELRAVIDAGWTDEDVTEVFGHLMLNMLTNYFWKVSRNDVDFPILRLFDQNKISRGGHPFKEVA